MSNPGKHHFVPVFYLKSWRGKDGKIFYFYLINDKVTVNKNGPKGIAYEVGLYSLTNVSEDKRQAIEKDFMSKEVDDKAAVVYQKIIESGIGKLNPKEKNDWVTFLISLRIRAPKMINSIKLTASQEFKEILEKDPNEYVNLKNEEHPETLTEWVQEEFPARMENIGLLILPEIIFDNDGSMKEARDRILKMKWWVVDFKDATVDLLTSDNPFIVINGIEQESSLIALPLSPNLAFFASPNRKMIESLRQNGASKLARRLNESTAIDARKYVYASGNGGRSHETFIEKRLQKGNLLRNEAIKT